jgi:hypothetical protein
MTKVLTRLVLIVTVWKEKTASESDAQRGKHYKWRMKESSNEVCKNQLMALPAGWQRTR